MLTDIKVIDVKYTLFYTGIIFLLTLQSYYFYEIRLSPFPLLSFFLFFITQEKIKFDKSIFILSASFLSLFLLSIIIGIIQKLDIIYINSVYGILLGPIFLLLFINFLNKIGKINYSKVISIVLALHLIFFFFQFFSFFLFNLEIDYLKLITGEESRFNGYGAISDLIRCTGLFNEPATYSYFIFSLVYIRFLCNMNLSLIDHIGLLSILLTFSFSGIGLFVFMHCYYWIIIKKNVKSLVVFLFLILAIIWIVEIFFNETLKFYLINRIMSFDSDNSTNTRLSDGFNFFFSLPFSYQIFGIGVGNYSFQVSTTASSYMYIFTTFGFALGFMFLILFILYFCKFKINFIYIIPIFALLFTTLVPMMIYFWFLVGSTYVKGNHKI